MKCVSFPAYNNSFVKYRSTYFNQNLNIYEEI